MLFTQDPELQILIKIMAFVTFTDTTNAAAVILSVLANTNNFDPLTASCKARAGSSPLGISYEITQKLLSLPIAVFRVM